MNTAVSTMKTIYNMSLPEWYAALGKDENEYWERKFYDMRANMFVALCELDEESQERLWTYAQVKQLAYKQAHEKSN